MTRNVGIATLLAAGLVAGCASDHGEAGAARERESTEILWDEWGVPHVFAADEEQLFFAHGWAQAKSHGDLVLRLLGQARGRAAEYWGEEYLDSDRWLHTVGVPARAERWYESQQPAFRAYLDAFTRGINAYARQHADRIDDEVEVVLPVHGRDVLAHVQQAVHFTFIVDAGIVTGAQEQLEQKGSNAWAVAPSRTESGHAMLVVNPHLPWSERFTWFEVQLTSPEMNAYGVALVGMPFLGIGFNDHLGWTHTVNTHDGADLYELELVDGGYRFDGRVRPFHVEKKTLLVKTGDGSKREEPLEIQRSVHGPVIARHADRALALRVVGLEAAHTSRQYWDMAGASNLEEFETALRQMQMPMFTVMYADREGHVMHLFGGETPVRPSGDWDYWSEPVPGDTAETLWTEIHEYDDLPRLLDPESNWLQNANDPPWTTTFPATLDAGNYPAYMAPRFMHFRAQRSARMLQEDESLTFEEVVDCKHSTRMELADRILDDLDAAVEQHGSELAARANRVLQKWDRAADAGSRGGVLFAEFVGQLTREGTAGVLAVEWNEDEPLRTPDGLADPAAAAAALEAAARQVEKAHGALDVAWGEVYRLRSGDRDLPANGGSGGLGIFRVVGYQQDDDGRYRAASGDSYVAVIEFSDPVRARALLSYGNSSQPGSPHNGDQLELFSRQELRPIWRTRAEIEQHLEDREQPSG